MSIVMLCYILYNYMSMLYHIIVYTTFAALSSLYNSVFSLGLLCMVEISQINVIYGYGRVIYVNPHGASLNRTR